MLNYAYFQTIPFLLPILNVVYGLLLVKYVGRNEQNRHDGDISGGVYV